MLDLAGNLAHVLVVKSAQKHNILKEIVARAAYPVSLAVHRLMKR
jgi:hypothetical protein